MKVSLPAGAKIGDVVLKASLELQLPRLKYGCMGRPGSGKSTLLASMASEANPLLCIVADPEEKLTPYFDRCTMIKEAHGQFGQPIFIGLGPSGKPMMQLEQFYDSEPKNPQAITNLLARAEQLKGEVDTGLWASIGFDSWTQFERFAIWRRSTGVFAVKDADAFGRAHGAAKDDLLAIVTARLMPLKCNIGIVFHTKEKPVEEGGEAFYGIKAIGQAPTELSSLLPERYRSVSMPDGTTRMLFTRPDGRYDLCTLVDAPSPCPNNFKALFSNWIVKEVTKRAAQNAAQPATA